MGKYIMDIPKRLKKEIKDYCQLNDITDVETFMLDVVKQGFNIEKYGTTPFKIGVKEPEIIEREVEKIIEIIKEVEKIVEVPVEKVIIREVEKIVEVPITDNKLIDKLNQEKHELNILIDTLKEKLKDESNKTEELLNSDSGTINKLNQTINNLKVELELEKNRHYKQPKKEKPKEDSNSKKMLKNVIKWVTREDRDHDLYDE